LGKSALPQKNMLKHYARISVIFFGFCLYVTLSNDEVSDNGDAIKQCNFQNNYGTVAQRKACSCATFNVFDGPPVFFLRIQFLPKITIFHFTIVKSHNGERWHEGGDLRLPFPRQILINSLKGIYPFGAKLYQN